MSVNARRPYRSGIGIMLLNRDRLAFLGRRVQMLPGVSPWQMPQGGIDAGESPRRAAWRELKEETGTDQAEILAESETWLYHEVPSEISDGVMGGRYRGNCQKWFAMGFTGEDTDINLANEHPEFDTWRWIKPQALPELVAPFMRQLYFEILAEFRPFWSRS